MRWAAGSRGRVHRFPGEQHGVPQAVSCRALGVSQSWFYKWKAGELPPRAARRERLKAEIARLFAKRQGKDGAPRITSALRDAGWRASKNTVAGLMRELGLAARPGLDFQRLTAHCDLVSQQHPPAAPGAASGSARRAPGSAPQQAQVSGFMRRDRLGDPQEGHG